jgi:hypothetical protein
MLKLSSGRRARGEAAEPVMGGPRVAGRQPARIAPNWGFGAVQLAIQALPSMKHPWKASRPAFD